MNWQGKLCVITGASSGFGYEVAKLFAEKGAHVIAVARREEKLKNLVAELGGEPHSYETCDVSELSNIRDLVQRISTKHQHVDILVSNAGIATSGPILKSTSEKIEQVIKTNLLAAIWCTKEFLPLLDAASRTGKTPVIVNVASMAGRLPTPHAADYAASKFGLVGFTEAVWHDLRDKDIRSMMVNPGLADTEGFPMDLIKNNPLLSWAVMDAGRVARALVNGIERGSFEVRVQWWLHPVYYASIALGPLRRFVSHGFKEVTGEIRKDR